MDARQWREVIIGSTGDQVIGQSQAHGRALLARLLDWTAQPAFSYRHAWQEGDCVVWDNTCAPHGVIPYAADSGRMMHRTAVADVEAVAQLPQLNVCGVGDWAEGGVFSHGVRCSRCALAAEEEVDRETIREGREQCLI